MSAMPAAGNTAADLLNRAARCYARANWLDDACRLFLLLQDGQNAAPYLEQLGRHGEAAVCYERAGNWGAAARCHLRIDNYDQAAEDLYRLGDRLRAAWLWAHQARRPNHAERVLDEIAADADPDLAGVELVRCRCHAAAGRIREGARLFRSVIGRFSESTLLTGHLDWTLDVAQALGRPDLAVLVHATAYRLGLIDAHRRWHDWAERTLGDGAGVPAAPLELHEPTTSPIQQEGDLNHGR